MTLSDFIVEHSSEDTSRLILNRSKWLDIDVEAAVTAIECRRKIRTKLPEWYNLPELVYPDRISSEQASSSYTASYKASVAERILLEEAQRTSGESSCYKHFRIADLTGGLGVDSLAFSRVSGKVLYNEMDAKKASAATHNFPLLGVSNIVVTNYCVSENSPFWDVLRDFNPDLIFLDPARRSETGNKVFLLEDCSPDVLTLLPQIFSITGNLLLKLSPMADITMLVNRLQEHGGRTKEVHVVATGGECKELLLWVVPCSVSLADDTPIFATVGGATSFNDDAKGSGSSSSAADYETVTCTSESTATAFNADTNASGASPSATDSETAASNFGRAAVVDDAAYRLIINENGQITSLPSDTEAHSEPVLFNSEEDFLDSGFLFEPGKAFAKAGVFNTLCHKLNLYKAGVFTHIFFSSGQQSHATNSTLPKIDYKESASQPDFVTNPTPRNTASTDKEISLQAAATASGDGETVSLQSCGKLYEILEIAKFNKRSIKEFAMKYPNAEVTAKNISVKSETLKDKLKCKSGGDIHIFGIRVDFKNGSTDNYLIATRKLNAPSEFRDSDRSCDGGIK